MSKRHELGVGLLVIGAAALMGWMSLRVGGFSVGDELHVSAVFQDAAGLNEGAAVTIAGVEVGTVRSMTVDFDQAIVELSIDPDAGVREDVIVAMRSRSILGEKYVELVPVSRDAPLLQDGAVLTDTRGQLEIDQLVTALGPLVEGLDPDTVSAALDPWIEAMAEDPERPARMLDDAEALLANLREVSEDAPAMMSEVRSTLGEARGAVRDVRQLTDRGERTLDRADALLADLEELTEDLPAQADRLPGLLDEVEAALGDTHELVAELNGKTGQVSVILDNLEEIDKWELRRILREEGITVRLRAREIEEED